MNFSETEYTLPCSLTSRNLAAIVGKIAGLKSSVIISKVGGDGRLANAKSMLGILSLCLKEGDIINIICRDIDKEQSESDIEMVIDIIKEFG